MALFGRIRAGVVYGKAAGMFLRKDYLTAARLFERFCVLTPGNEGKEFAIAYLGRCHAALGRHVEALRLFEDAYGRFSLPTFALRNDSERQAFREFLEAFSAELRRAGQTERAAAIDQRITAFHDS